MRSISKFATTYKGIIVGYGTSAHDETNSKK